MAVLSGKVAIVTGASRGLGKAIAMRFADQGAKVAILARTEEPHPRIAGTIHETAEGIMAGGGVCLPLKCNVGSAEDIANAVNATLGEFGRIDIVIHNAAANFQGGPPIKEIDMPLIGFAKRASVALLLLFAAVACGSDDEPECIDTYTLEFAGAACQQSEMGSRQCDVRCPSCGETIKACRGHYA